MIKKKCCHCKNEKPLALFWKSEKYKHGVMSRCIACSKFQSSIKGTLQHFKTHRWQSILLRSKDWLANGVDRPLKMTKEEFFYWCDSVADQIAACKRPSVDRIDNDRGYEVENIRVIEYLENAKRGSRQRWESSRCPVIATSLDGRAVKRYESYYHARADGFHPSAICSCLKGKRTTHGGYAWTRA
jgi:hypothetical protein